MATEYYEYTKQASLLLVRQFNDLLKVVKTTNGGVSNKTIKLINDARGIVCAATECPEVPEFNIMAKTALLKIKQELLKPIK